MGIVAPIRGAPGGTCLGYVRINAGVLTCLLLLLLAGWSLNVPVVRVNITAVFEAEDFEEYQTVFFRTLQDFNNASQGRVHFFGQVVLADPDYVTTISNLCNLLEGRLSSSHVLLVFGKVSTVQTYNLLSQSLGIPLMGYMTDKDDGYVQVSVTFLFLEN